MFPQGLDSLYQYQPEWPKNLCRSRLNGDSTAEIAHPVRVQRVRRFDRSLTLMLGANDVQRVIFTLMTARPLHVTYLLVAFNTTNWAIQDSEANNSNLASI